MVVTREHIEQRKPPSAASRWWWVLRGGLLAAAFFYLYAPVLPPLIADWWHDPDYSHGFLIPLLSAYFVWERRQRLAVTRSASSLWGLFVLLGGLVLFLLGNIGAELFTMRFSMLVVLSGLVLYHLGWRVLRILTFPLAFLLFMIPWPAIILNMVTLPLQLLAAQLSTFALQLLTLPVYREGNIIFLPHTTLEIVDACSGLRSLLSLTALAVVFAYVSQRRVWQRVVLVVSSVPIALLANAFRIWGTGILAHLYGTQVAEGFYHTFAGWLIFVVAFLLLAAEGLLVSRLGARRAAQETLP